MTYYQQHRERLLELSKQYYKRDRQKILERNKKYRETHREQYLKRRRENYRKNKTRFLQRNEKYRQQRREELFSLIGRKCIVCGTEEKLHFHEVHGKDHQQSNPFKDYKYIETHYKDFIPLCNKHHFIIHGLVEHCDLDKLVKLVNLLRELNVD